MSISQDAHEDRRARQRKAVRKYTIKKKYGLTVDEYDRLMAEPCSICGGKSEHLDHCHDTGVIRGPLCMECNHGLGKFKDNPDILRAAIAYLEERS